VFSKLQNGVEPLFPPILHEMVNFGQSLRAVSFICHLRLEGGMASGLLLLGVIILVGFVGNVLFSKTRIP